MLVPGSRRVHAQTPPPPPPPPRFVFSANKRFLPKCGSSFRYKGRPSASGLPGRDLPNATGAGAAPAPPPLRDSANSSLPPRLHPSHPRGGHPSETFTHEGPRGCGAAETQAGGPTASTALRGVRLTEAAVWVRCGSAEDWPGGEDPRVPVPVPAESRAEGKQGRHRSAAESAARAQGRCPGRETTQRGNPVGQGLGWLLGPNGSGPRPPPLRGSGGAGWLPFGPNSAEPQEDAHSGGTLVHGGGRRGLGERHVRPVPLPTRGPPPRPPSGEPRAGQLLRT